MASERDREIWDDATNAVCQAMQEQNMCNCPDGGCLAAKIEFAPEKVATATRPAPAAADTGLVTYAHDNGTLSGLSRNEHGPWCLRSQAEAIIAAERAEKEKWKVRGDQHWDTLRSIREMAREGDCERIILWVNDAGSGYTEPLEATVKSLTDKAVALEADNAALTARVKELTSPEYLTEKLVQVGVVDKEWKDRAQALEAKLAAARKALEPFADHANDRAVDDTGWRDKETVKIVVSIGDLRKARAVLGWKPS
ncbi:hypothetical protein DK867_02515 [Ochrobactrum sp. POC9]|uniref:hypothetical protein n=1 Tax=Ochrobactrum sp. POC9 TaxID=2203419 RepID=UPI000D70767E|nr:hypothetical protein [Ochrobactrum sp. POC9]PWU76163.1 hypothetical protein DK867_02515 [Ochrobactrum sp. POC9]